MKLVLPNHSNQEIISPSYLKNNIFSQPNSHPIYFNLRECLQPVYLAPPVHIQPVYLAPPVHSQPVYLNPPVHSQPAHT